MHTRTLVSLIDQHGGLIQTGPFGSQLHQHDYSEDGIPVVMPKDIVAGRVDEGSVARIPETKARQLSRHVLKTGDIVFPRRGEIGKCALIDEAQEGFLCGTGCIKIEIPKKVYSTRFLYYYLGLREVVEWLERNAIGTTMLNLNTSILGDVRIPDVDLAFQERVASTLSAYDDLIENDRRRIQLLEQAARLLYKEWFVHLRFPGHEHVKIKNGVPEGWGQKTIASLTTFLNRGIAPQYDDGAEGLVINQKCIRGGRLDLSLARHQSREFKLDRQVLPGDVLVNSTGEGTLGRVAQVLTPIDNCTVDTHVTIVRPVPKIGANYFGQTLIEWEPRFSTMGRGATNQTELSRGQIGDAQIVVPSRVLMQQFEEVTIPLFRQVSFLMGQIEKLRAVRNLLLPRLMNGEIEL